MEVIASSCVAAATSVDTWAPASAETASVVPAIRSFSIMTGCRSEVTSRSRRGESGGDRRSQTGEQIAVVQRALDQLALGRLERRAGELNDLREHELEIGEEHAHARIACGG